MHSAAQNVLNWPLHFDQAVVRCFDISEPTEGVHWSKKVGLNEIAIQKVCVIRPTRVIPEPGSQLLASANDVFAVYRD